MRFVGFIRTMVGSEQRFINKDPSPSSAITLRCGKPRAMPNAMEEQSPNVLTRKFPSPGRRAFHSNVVAPAELTTKASFASPDNAFKQSNRLIAFYFRSLIWRGHREVVGLK